MIRDFKSDITDLEDDIIRLEQELGGRGEFSFISYYKLLNTRKCIAMNRCAS